jgi:hypothetical protein
VGTEIQAATLKFNADARLAAAAGGVARYFADGAGMEPDAIANLQADTLAACQAAFAHLTRPTDQLSVEITRFADRIEVAVAYPGADASQPSESATRITKYLTQSSPGRARL